MTTQTMYYVLHIEFDGDHPIISVHSTQAEANAALRKFAAKFFAEQGDPLPGDDELVKVLLENYRLVDCVIYVCPADGSPNVRVIDSAAAEETAAAFQSLIDDGSIVPHPDGLQRRNRKGELEPVYIAAEVAAEIIKKRG